MDEFDPIKQRIREALITDAPEPWKLLGTIVITDIMEVGFAEDSEMLLVLSGHGRELIDCRSGRRVARDPGVEHRSSWYGAHDLIGQGFGPMTGRQMRLTGAGGGGLSFITRDGWGAVRAPVQWPDEFLLLTAPYSSIYQPQASFWKLVAAREAVAWGFSYTGKTLIAATAEGVTIFARQ
jgi:hypothetical protein